jgi:flagellar basal-body rod modification protein FlgD
MTNAIGSTGISADLLEKLNAAGTPLSTSSSTNASQTISQNEFLTLFVAQLQHQDPLSPMEPNELTAQLAQFSSLEQLTGINERLDNLADVSQKSTDTSVLGLIGRSITFDGSLLGLDDGKATPVDYTLNEAADVVATIKNAKGEVVRRVELGTQGVGPHRFEFDGDNSRGVELRDGTYTLEITAQSAGADTPKKLALSTTADVDGVDLTSQPPVLVAGGVRLTLDKVRQVNAAATD